MKKVALSLLALALVGGAAFADATADVVKNPVTATLDVNAAVSLGYDLDSQIHGFKYESTGALTLWFLNGSSTKDGDGAIHGSITAADVKLGFDDSATPNNLDAAKTPTVAFGDITAKIVGENFYVQISTVRTASQAYGVDGDDDNGGASIVADDTFYRYKDKYGATADATNEWTTGTLAGYDFLTGAGVEVGYTLPNLAQITVVTASQGTWTGTQQTDYDYSLAVAQKAVDKLTLEGKYYGDAASKLTAAGVTVGYDLGVVAPFADFNYNITNSKYEADFGSKLPLADGLKAVVVGKYNSESMIDLTATLDLASGKLAGPLSADVGVRALDATKVAESSASFELFAKVGFKASDVLSIGGTVDAINADSLFAKANIEYTGISLTTLGVYWDSSDLGAAKSTAGSKLGQVYGKIKIAY